MTMTPHPVSPSAPPYRDSGAEKLRKIKHSLLRVRQLSGQ